LRPLSLWAPAALALICAATVARADDYVSVRGAYYREPSTRVIQPTVEVERDSATGLDVAAHYLVDAITSASASAGTGVDTIFTEIRNEASLRVRKRWERTEAWLGYKYSAESDYWSHAIGGSVSHRFWGDTARLSLSLGRNFDSVSSRGRTPECATPPSTSCALNGYFAGVAYTQVLSPVMIAQVSYDGMYLHGFQGNLYRSVPNFGYEKLPDKRMRNAITPRIAYYLPRTGTGFQLQYRFYFDFYPGDPGPGGEPWGLRAHTIEGRVFQTFTPTLEVRLSYRQYFQNSARFLCDQLLRTDCFNATYYSTDPKLTSVHTEYPELKVLWQAEALAPLPFFRWFAAGTFEISYGYYFQNTSFGNAHVLQMGYRMPY
jgi:hypothetical protein